MKLIQNKNLILIPTLMTSVIFAFVTLFPDLFSVPMIILCYWALGTILFFTITKVFNFELKSRHQISQELDQQKKYLENLIGSAPEGIVWVGQNNNIKYVNKKFTEIFGFTNSEAYGQNVDKLINKADTIENAQAITHRVSQGTTQEAEGIRYRKDGTPVHVSIVGAPMVSIKGYQEVFGIYRDITKEKEAEKQLIASEKDARTLSDQLTQANNFKELLLDIITHDLRNPTGVISGAVELLDSELPNHELVELIRNSADNLSQVIEDAQTLSKLSMGESIKLEEIDVISLMRGVALSFSSQLESADLALKIDLPETLHIKSNRIFGEVISNYLSNAIKYAAHGKKLVLTAIEEPDRVEIQLKDFGDIIPEEKRESVFGRKIQLLNGPRKGSGLGLAIVKRIADAHHAEVGVKPNEPRGNIFFFRFNL